MGNYVYTLEIEFLVNWQETYLLPSINFSRNKISTILQAKHQIDVVNSYCSLEPTNHSQGFKLQFQIYKNDIKIRRKNGNFKTVFNKFRFLQV